MAVETELFCPLGKECTSIVDGKLMKCMWLVSMRGQDAMGEDHDKENCAIAWQPLLAVESSRHNVANTAAVNSLRNETLKRQDAAIKVMANMTPSQLLDK